MPVPGQKPDDSIMELLSGYKESEEERNRKARNIFNELLGDLKKPANFNIKEIR